MSLKYAYPVQFGTLYFNNIALRIVLRIGRGTAGAIGAVSTVPTAAIPNPRVQSIMKEEVISNAF